MKKFIYILNHLGFPITESTNPLVLFLGWILLYTIFALLCVINILIYVGVIYLLEDKNRLDKIKKYLPSFISPYFDRFINYIKTVRIIAICIEVLILLFILITNIYTTAKIINLLLQ
jgi:hypothetical protein